MVSRTKYKQRDERSRIPLTVSSQPLIHGFWLPSSRFELAPLCIVYQRTREPRTSIRHILLTVSTLLFPLT